MSQDIHTCPKCEAKMEEGFILDRSIEATRPSYWTEGRWEPPEPPTTATPERFVERTRKRLSQIKSQLTKSRLRDHIPVVSFRCTRCGYLESYASPE